MKLVSLLNNAYIIAIKNLKVNISANYEYVTDPPYLADIGSISFVIDDFCSTIKGSTEISNQGYFSIHLA